MTIWLVLTICSILDPSNCQRVELATLFNNTHSCSMLWQSLGAEYVKDRPKWFIQKAKCVTEDQMDREL